MATGKIDSSGGVEKNIRPPLELARRYLDIFCSGDVEALRPLFHKDLLFEGPFSRFDSAGAYLSALNADPPRGISIQILAEFEKDQLACLIYEFRKDGIRTPMAQLFEIRDGKICRIKLIFDRADFD